MRRQKATRKMKRRKNYLLRFFILELLFLFIIVAYHAFQSDFLQDNLNSGNADWKLILVNKTHPIPDNYKVKLTTLANGKKVDSRIYPALQKMFNAARASGLGLFVREGYRTQKAQQQIMDEKIAYYQDQGNSKKDAKKLAKEYVATPGTSEHQLGLSVDINADTDECSSDQLYEWLDENAYKYGFIKRYPEDKTSITGINNEPWHYRYVGKAAAWKMQKKHLCLEEYLGEASSSHKK